MKTDIEQELNAIEECLDELWRLNEIRFSENGGYTDPSDRYIHGIHCAKERIKETLGQQKEQRK